MAAATKQKPPDDSTYIETFLGKIKEAGESVSRRQFFRILDDCRPPSDRSAAYFDYDVLFDHFALTADFAEAWDYFIFDPLPRITTIGHAGEQQLPAGFCTIGGTPDWIQGEDYPICNKCDADMVLLVQLKSVPREITKLRKDLGVFSFGDAGNFYVFVCPRCGTRQTRVDSH